jgi:FSR family fosmidomycin resistance protein-like MFS transporter
LTAIEERRKAARGANQLKDDWPEFWKVSAVNTFRCIIFNATQTFIPLFWTGVFLVSESQGSLMLTIVSLVGAVGTFFGGRIADRLGFKRDIVSCTACLIAGIALFVLAANAYLQVLAAILVCLSMLFLQTAYSPVITLSQKQLPNHLGMASGIALGVSVSIGSICSPILGVIGDHCGLIVVFYIVLGLAVCVFLLSLFLKNDRSHSVAKREPETK